MGGVSRCVGLQTVQLKNGWLRLNRGRWRVHSIGHVAGAGRNYLISILSSKNPSFTYGRTTVEGISRIVWRDLGTP